MVNQVPSADPPGLLPRLTWYQIFMICIGGTVGVGFARSSGEIMAIAGPGGCLIAFTVVGVVAVCVMEGVCEMINLWPISNAMIEFVRAFVDPDLAVIVGFTYWYAYCCSFAALIIAAGSVLQYFNISSVLLNIIFVVSLLVIFLINCCSVSLFGQIEFYGGILKLLLLAGIFVLMICINVGVNTDHQIGSTPFIDGVRNNPNVAATHGIAVLIAIPLAVFAYIGVELVTVTAFEAADPRDLRHPAKNIAYVILIIYVITVGGISANVEWFDRHLLQFYSQGLVPLTSSVDTLGHSPIADQTKKFTTTFAPVIAALEAGPSYASVATTLLGFLVYSALSCANANLYVASRTLYGLTRDLDLNSRSFFERFLAHLNMVTPKWRVPLWSVIASLVLVSAWLPFVKLGLGADDLFQVMSSIGSVGVLLVWASQCLAFIRYHKWLWIHRDELNVDNYQKFQRWPIRNEFSSYAALLQPFPAYLGLVSCLTIVFFFNSASMWNGNQVLIKGLSIYLAPSLSLLLFIILKFVNRRGWVRLSDNWSDLHVALDRLDSLVQHRSVAYQSTTPAMPPGPPFMVINRADPACFSDSGYSDHDRPQPTPSPARFSPPQDIHMQPMNGRDPMRRSLPLGEINEVEAEHPGDGYRGHIEQPGNDYRGYIEQPVGHHGYAEQPGSYQGHIEPPSGYQGYIEQPGGYQGHVERPGEYRGYIERPGGHQGHVDQPSSYQTHVDQPSSYQTHVDQPSSYEGHVDQPSVGYYGHSPISPPGRTEYYTTQQSRE